jgi:hypothetical protein
MDLVTNAGIVGRLILRAVDLQANVADPTPFPTPF